MYINIAFIFRILLFLFAVGIVVAYVDIRNGIIPFAFYEHSRILG